MGLTVLLLLVVVGLENTIFLPAHLAGLVAGLAGITPPLLVVAGLLVKVILVAPLVQQVQLLAQEVVVAQVQLV
jgi:hypothetical protein